MTRPENRLIDRFDKSSIKCNLSHSPTYMPTSHTSHKHKKHTVSSRIQLTMRRACQVAFILSVYIALLLLITTNKAQMGYVSGCHDLEREALLKFKGSVYSDPTNRFSSWKGDDCCRWQGVTCHHISLHVLQLDLHNDHSSCFDMRLYTDTHRFEYPAFDHTECEIAISSALTFPSLSLSLLDLKELSYLDLSGNNFNWSRIPEFIGSMNNLRYLNLSNARFSGIIPPQLGNLTSLHTLDVHNTYSVFSVFPSTPLMANNIGWISKLVNLQYLDMSNIDLIPFEACNSIQVLFDLPLLLDLRISGTKIAGSPHFSSCYYNLTLPSRILHLDLSRNFLEGPIPHFLANMSSLRFLDLSYNLLNGSFQVLAALPSLLDLRLQAITLGNAYFSLNVSTDFSLPSTIQHLDLSGNSLEGSFPQFLSNMSSIRFLDLSGNSFNGSIPLWLRNMRGLEFLSLRGDPFANNLRPMNSFSNVEGGTIMGILGNLCNLKVLDVSYNYVLGGDVLSSSYKNLSNCKTYDLETLDFSFNNVTSTLPEWLGDLKKLKFLALSHNRIYGPVPSCIGNLSLLQLLFLEDNALYGSIPSSLGDLSSLTSLDLSVNFFEGSVSNTHIANLSSLKYLDLSFNAVNLNFSFDELPLFQLLELHMTSCKLEGQFPQWIKMQSELTLLDLSNNAISGELREWIPSTNLRELNLSNNHIVGPALEFPSSSKIFILDLSNNLFSGPLSFDQSKTSLCNLMYLETLVLKGNQFSGTIPDCWGYSNNIWGLDLSFNRLTGTIPTTFGRLLQLYILKLNNNALEGEIPLTLKLCSNLKILNLGENKLTGMIPNWGRESHPSLAVLRLRANQLEGVIPPQLCSFSQIKILDLAVNNITGTIPRCFGHFINMNSHSEGQIYTPPSSQDDAMVVFRGEELEYTHTLMLVLNLDLSCNGLVGSIPEELANLTGLIGLNLSYNHLTGIIPEKIGKMTALESLDLSNNNLSGTIPSSMAALTALSSLNLSSNKLRGEIPTGPQLQTLNDPSIYGDNAGLCGAPLPNDCGNKHSKPHHQEEEEEEVEDNNENIWFYLVVLLGFATGFWGVVGSLWLKKSWRYVVFRRVESWMK